MVQGIDPAIQYGSVAGIRASLAALSNQIGVVAVIALIGMWLHAITCGGARNIGTWGVGAMARGALLGPADATRQVTPYEDA